MRGSNENDGELQDDTSSSNASGLLHDGMGNYKTKLS